MTEVAVIGGGVIGLACAEALAARGVTVTVLEAAAALGQASTARANGGFRAQFTTAPNIAFSMFSIEVFETMPAQRIGLHQTGYVLMAGTPEGVDLLRRSSALQRSLGVDTEWLETDAIVARAPFVRAEGILAGTFHGRDGFLDPAGVCGELADRLTAAGATILTDAAVVGVSRGVGSFLLSHEKGALRADVVVNAAGAQARDIARLCGGDIPVEPVRRNLAHIQDEPGELTPMVVDLDTGVVVRREPAGGWIVAYADPHDRPGRETVVDPAFAEALAERLPRRFPFLLDLPADPRRWWAGLYPETPDHHAIIGFDGNVPGLVQCAGFGGHGVMHAPAAGRAVAELIVDGDCTSFDLLPLRPSRFAEGDLVIETAVF
jgi:sarcosine oxidase subunit beta